MPRVDPVNGADPRTPSDDEPVPAAESRLRRLRVWLGEHPSSQSPPFSRQRWLRLLTYLATCYLALGVALAGGGELSDEYLLSTAQGLLAGFTQAVAVVLALRRPVPAWGLSLAPALLTAVAARPHLANTPLPGPDWPWGTPTLLAHMAVLLLLAVRVRTAGAIAALAGSALATYLVQGVLGAQRYSSTGVVAIMLFAVSVLVGTALRGRSEARKQLVEQTTITAEERARRTLLEERSRIARELHDVVAHHMSVISIQAQVAPHLVDNPSEELKENLAGIRQNALEALTELRRVLGVLRSEEPDDLHHPQPTLDRLDALLENTRAAGLDIETDIRGGPTAYPPGVELSAYRIIQEALSNVLRHAPGSQVRVEVSHFRDGVHLGVINSRPGQAVPASPGSGHGLLGMRERAAMLGGSVTATPTLHGGFMVTAFLPRGGGPTTPPASDDEVGAPGKGDELP
ncbi:sensor histidine kinase [Streptomyces sp. NPDC054794]